MVLNNSGRARPRMFLTRLAIRPAPPMLTKTKPIVLAMRPYAGAFLNPRSRFRSTSASATAAPVGMSIQFDMPISVIVLNTLRTLGSSALAAATINGSMRRKLARARETAISTWSEMGRSFRRNAIPSHFGKGLSTPSRALHRFGGTRCSLAEPNEIDVARVDGEACGLADNEHGIGAVASISEQQQATEKAEIPECLGNDAGACPFRRNPLHDESHRE